ncbi:MAG: FkbM family methyltransferase [Candidatus Taylorbacteria bacterium]|nr:FkbM family methyltransferase [Candidatus Taylorbacteria bacterium]
MKSKHSLVDYLKIPPRYLVDKLLLLASSPFGKKFARYFFGLIRFPHDVRIHLGKDTIHVNTWDRFIVVFLSKLSLLENTESKILKDEIKEGMTVLDVGANIGVYTLKVANLVGPTGRVWAFEPDQNNYSSLTKNVNTNRYGNVTLINKAVADKTGTSRLFISEENRGDHRIFSSDEQRISVPIEIVALDDIFLREKIDFIKMDIQGAEYLALTGMSELIQRNRDIVILIEFAPNWLKDGGSSGQQLLDKIIDLGFPLKYVDDKTGQIRSIDKTSLLDSCKGNKYCTLYLKKQ